MPGGGGDIVANVFVLGRRFDSIKMDHNDAILTRGGLEESGNFVAALNFTDSRATPAMFGYLELLARELTADLRAIESSIRSAGVQGHQFRQPWAQPRWQCV